MYFVKLLKYFVTNHNLIFFLPGKAQIKYRFEICLIELLSISKNTDLQQHSLSCSEDGARGKTCHLNQNGPSPGEYERSQKVFWQSDNFDNPCVHVGPI